MKLAHLADAHLSSSGNRLDSETGLNAALMDRYRCLKWAVNDAIEQGAEVVLFAGDLFNSSKPNPTERRLAIDALSPATDRGKPVLLLLGNHEASRSPLDKHALDTMREIAGVTVIDRPCMLELWARPNGTIRVLDMETAPEPDEEAMLQIACLPYPSANLLLADEEARKLSPGDRNLLIREKMMDCARGLAAQRIEGVPSVLLGHFSVDVAIAGAQDRLMLLGGEWTLNLQELESLGFDAVLLGHIHKPQSLGTITAYCGSPEACSFGEEGEEKSYSLLSEIRPGIFEREVIPTPYRKLVTLNLDGSDAPAVIDESLRDAIVRVRISAAAAPMLDMTELRRQIEETGAFEVRVEVERAESVRRRDVEVSAGMDLPAAIRIWVEQKPDLNPLTEQIIELALEVEAAVGGGA